jgi:hypothetical protein
MTASSPVKGVTPFPPEFPSSYLPLVGAPEIMKFFIMPVSFSLCLTGYVSFGQTYSRILFKWSIGGRARHLKPHSVATTHSVSEPSTFLSSALSQSAATATYCGPRFLLFLPPLVPFLAPWRVMTDGATRLPPGTTSLPPGARTAPAATSSVA